MSDEDVTGLVLTDKSAQHYADAIHRRDPDLALWFPGDAGAVNAEVAISWAPSAETLRELPCLRLIHSIGAGVDRIVSAASGLDVSVCRIVDDQQARSMAQYVVWGVLNYHREFDAYRANQKAKAWVRNREPHHGSTVVGIMGMGLMGRTVAALLVQFGLEVRGWSLRRAEVGGVRCYDGSELDEFLSGAQILVCLLPLTESTRGILSRDLLRKLPPGARLIHAGRGEHLQLDDLVDALDSGHLAGALLDVFPKEPLPDSDVLWAHGKIIVTPHIAAISSSDVVAEQIVANVRRLRAGLPLDNEVKQTLGY
jgi:glyoxylate/hydroxypyruvate reductase A